MAFRVNSKQLKRVDLVEVGGRVDSNTAPQFEAAVQKIIDDGRSRLVVDLTSVEYMSSAAFRVLISALKQVKKGARHGDVRLAGVSQKLMDTFKLGGFDDLFKFYDTPEEAVGSF
ncbi:MAG TPA: STAS domain-containing protein [Anaerolineae bacterium]|nr:STAS domain-containing protein [Anaerolineae bacterium]